MTLRNQNKPCNYFTLWFSSYTRDMAFKKPKQVFKLLNNFIREKKKVKRENWGKQRKNEGQEKGLKKYWSLVYFEDVFLGVPLPACSAGVGMGGECICLEIVIFSWQTAMITTKKMNKMKMNRGMLVL